MITGGNYSDGSYADNFNTSLNSNSQNILGAKPSFLLSNDFKKTKVRPIDANQLIVDLINLEHTGLDDETIRRCIQLVKESPTIKKKFHILKNK